MNIAAIGLLLTFGVMAGMVLHEVGVTPRRSLSQHIAKSPRTILYGKIGLTLGGVLFLLALIGYAMPKYHLGQGFTVTAVLASVLGTVTAYVPYNISKRQDLVHDICSYGYVALNPIILLMLLVALPQGPTRAAYVVGTIIQVMTILLLVTYYPARRYFLFGQILFLSVFATLLIAL